MGKDYRTGDNARMKACCIALLIYFLTPQAHAWNGAGHRLIATIAWQQLSASSRENIRSALARHPDHERWIEKSKSETSVAVFAEAATWSDSIRNDPRYYDELYAAPTPPIPGLFDHARHKRWHYADMDKDGKAAEGELDRQIERLIQVLRSTRNPEEITWALPWLLHLVGDIHQPMHVGYAHDEGGNLTEIENPFKSRQPFINLHSYWDDLPGPSSLRGKKLENTAADLVDRINPPKQGDVARSRTESRQLLQQAYPDTAGSLLPIVTEEFDRNARRLAEQQMVAAGYRLGRLLESIFSYRVSRETP